VTRAFVAGATGLTGREVVRALRERGIETAAHVRPDSARLAEWTERFGALGATTLAVPWEDAAIADALRELRPDIVFALLGTTRARARKGTTSAVPETYDAVDYGLTAMLLRACQSLDPKPRFVYLSSMGTSPTTRNPYLMARARVEAELQASGVPFVIARPSILAGDRDEARPGEALAARVADGALFVASALGLRTLRDRYRSTPAPQLARSLVRLALDPAAAGRIVLSDEL
jgi:nucleoside-diphosphate-sugar epimerase